MNIKLLFVFALIAIGVGLYGISIQLEPTSTLVQTPQAEKSPDIYYKVWRTKVALETGQKLDRSQVISESLLQADAEQQGVQANIPFEFEIGMVANQPIKADAILFPETITQPNDADYVNLILQSDHIAYALQVDSASVVGGTIDNGSMIDVLALISQNSNQSVNETSEADYRPANNAALQNTSISPVLVNVKVLAVKRQNSLSGGSSNKSAVLILELTRPQVSKLTIARHVAQIVVQPSFGEAHSEQLSANAGDVLPTFKSIRELRANKVLIN